MGIMEEGIEGEQWLIKKFIKNNIECFQPDLISLEKDCYIINETKHQEKFTSPPFDGHGLPLWQIKARIKFWLKTGIRCRLIVREKNTKIIYVQWLDILEKGEFFDTKGLQPRRVYNISLFDKHEEKICK